MACDGGNIRAAHPLGGTPMPARGGECLASFLPVVRQQRGAFVEMLRILLFDGPRHRRVY